MRKHKETEQEAIERRKQMYGCNGKCCDRVIDPETGARKKRADAMAQCAG